MNIDEQAAADAIMSARHSDAFDREACVKILQDARLTDSGDAFDKRPFELNEPPAQPKPESWPDKQEWTALTVDMLSRSGLSPLQDIANAHNSELAAERYERLCERKNAARELEEVRSKLYKITYSVDRDSLYKIIDDALAKVKEAS